MTAPLTDEERAAMAQLAYREAMTQWQESENQRVSDIAVFAPLVGFIDLTTALPMLNNISSAIGDFELKQRIHRLRTILSNEYGAIEAHIATLSSPAPLPTMAQIDFPPAETGGDEQSEGGDDDG